MDTEGFLLDQVARLTGASKANLAFWAKSDLLRPSIADGQGKGSRRVYGFKDVVALRTIEGLRRAGVSVQALRKVASHLRELGADVPFSECWLATNGVDVYTARGDELMALLRQPGQRAFSWAVVDVSEVVKEVREGIRQLAAA